MHYSGLQLTNFRGFQETPPIKLAPLTFLVGPNSSGKSSVFDALLLIAQSGFAPNIPAAWQPNWQGSLVDLGSYKDAVFRHDPDRDISIITDISLDGNEPSFFRVRTPDPSRSARLGFHLASTGRNDPIGRLAHLEVGDSASGENLGFSHSAKDPTKVKIEFLGRSQNRRLDQYPNPSFYFQREVESFVQKVGKEKGFPDKSAFQDLLYFATTPAFGSFSARTQRISSGRLGPKRWYSATGIKSSRSVRGLYDAVDPQMIEEVQRQERGQTRRDAAKHRQRVARFLKQLEIASAVKDVKLSPYHTAINVKDSITKIVSNLIDVGYGASQVLPVMLGCLSPSKSPLLVEQPEIHLHPRAQGTVAELLCATSKSRQVIVETHSEHMINRARILIAQGKLPAENVMVNYISRRKEGSFVEAISILPNGDFGSPWPSGFFDERYQDTMLLLDIKSRAGRKKNSGRRSR